ncbi:hypothetical protein G3O08_07295 [Cryomorpha ignava]|uniref:NRDE family protein n=1 Tax=Cryomorpha ignava TaxID=101383 RepID=A0A7K3WQK7_9FLAO|nr:NRDE family protein [Cryomorpha ignava]NEN23301.1 hypothetical protein [Cryomorpha ignava]
MCTLTYVPLKNEKIITANRDESPSRNASLLSPYFSAGGQAFYIAEEPLRGGTNIALGQNGRHSVLLNGAFEPHNMHQTYGMSRGIVLLKSLDCKNAFEFADQFQFKKENIQPFTLIDFSDSIRELRWDGETIFKKEFSLDEPHIWASAQLYSPEVLENRLKWFRNLLDKENITAKEILDFHFQGGNGDPENDLVMNRGKVCTVSITQVSEKEDQKAIVHFDLVRDGQTKYIFD